MGTKEAKNYYHARVVNVNIETNPVRSHGFKLAEFFIRYSQSYRLIVSLLTLVSKIHLILIWKDFKDLRPMIKDRVARTKNRFNSKSLDFRFSSENHDKGR